jgi:hypothetical protein
MYGYSTNLGDLGKVLVEMRRIGNEDEAGTGKWSRKYFILG